jgi:hypothetical protein
MVKTLSHRLEKIDTIKAILEEYTINEPYPQFIIEPEIVEYAIYITEKVVSRTKEQEGFKARKLGILGQELFNGFLLQYKIPNVYANPIYKDMRMRQIYQKHFDFIIPHTPKGTQILSIKTTPHGERYKRLMANVEQWENEIHDIVIAIKIDSLKELKAHIAGWLYSKEVEKLPIHDFGEGDAYYTFLNPTEAEEAEIPPLRNITNLMNQLLKGSYR